MLAGTLPAATLAEPFKLDPVTVTLPAVHPSQSVRTEAKEAFTKSRTSSSANGATLQNLNPVNKRDALRYNTVGLVTGPGAGDRYGGGSSIRTFGDFGAAESIDGLPAFRAAGQEGGGYNNTIVPSIAVERISVEKGGRAVGYGDGSDGGVLETTIKSGRGYDNHQAISVDANTADEVMVQGEAAHGTQKWDYYVAANGLDGRYDGSPANLKAERQLGALAKLGFNFGEDTRMEFLGIFDKNRPDIFRNGSQENITSTSYIGAVTIDSKLTESTAIRAGHQYTDTNSRWPARTRDRSIDTHIGFVDGYLNSELSDAIRYDGSLGVEYKRTNYLRDKQYDLVFHDYSLKNTNALTVNDNLVLNLGLREVWFENDLTLNGMSQPDNLQTDSLFAYDIGASYSVLEDTRVRGSIATGYNRFYSKYGNFGNDAFNPAGAQDEIVESITYEAGVRQGWTAGHVDLALYTIEQENVPRRQGGAIESVTVEQSGLEIEGQHQVTPEFAVSAGYMYVFDVQATRADGSSSGGNVFFGTNGVPVPTHQGLLRGQYQITPEWSVWGMGFYHSGYERDNDAPMDTETRDYFRVDLGVGWQPRDDLFLRVRLENALDQRDYGQTLEGAPVVDAGKTGRVFWLGVDYTF